MTFLLFSAFDSRLAILENFLGWQVSREDGEDGEAKYALAGATFAFFARPKNILN